MQDDRKAGSPSQPAIAHNINVIGHPLTERPSNSVQWFRLLEALIVRTNHNV